MSGIIFDNPFGTGWPILAAVFCTAAAVKLMDDVIDRPADRAFDRPNWTRRLGRSATAYALLLLTLAAAMSPAVTVTLFCAAYAWGMAGQWRERMPSGLPAIAETVFALVLPMVTHGLAATAVAVALVGAADLFDDVLDHPGRSSNRERLVAGLALAIFGLAVTPLVTAAAFAAAGLFIGPLAGPRQRRSDKRSRSTPARSRGSRRTGRGRS